MRSLMKAAGAALLVTVLATELGFLNRLLDTVSLSVDQWLVCIGASLAVIVVAEIRKLLEDQRDRGQRPRADHDRTRAGLTAAVRSIRQARMSSSSPRATAASTASVRVEAPSLP